MVPNHSFKCTKPIENHHQQQIIDHSIVLTNWLSLRARVFKSVQKNIYVIQNTECLRMSEKVRKVLRRPQLVWNWFNTVSFNWKFVASPFLPSWPIKKTILATPGFWNVMPAMFICPKGSWKPIGPCGFQLKRIKWVKIHYH